MNEKKSGKLIYLIIITLMVVFVFLSVNINKKMVIQTAIVSDLSTIEYLNSSAKRLSRMVITEQRDNRLLHYIDDQVIKYLYEDSEQKLSVLEFEEVKEIANTVTTTWNTLNELFYLSENEEIYDPDSIILASDSNFNSMTNLSIAIFDTNSQIIEEINELQMYSYGVIALMAFVIGNHLIATSIVLQKNEDLAILASIDIATGMYNRSKCQEVFQKEYNNPDGKESAMVVIDLNDLKATNDTYGHSVGDEFIENFAILIKSAVMLNPKKLFVGRYGGDEFVIFYQIIDSEDEVKKFVDDLANKVREFNEVENKQYEIAYAIGYAINGNKEERLTLRQLFDVADENMYINKREMKRIKLEQSKLEQK